MILSLSYDLPDGSRVYRTTSVPDDGSSLAFRAAAYLLWKRRVADIDALNEGVRGSTGAGTGAGREAPEPEAEGGR